MFTINYQEIGQRILKKRSEKDLSQSELAEEISVILNKQATNGGKERNISYRTIGNWESGATTKSLTLECLQALCQVLECDFHYLLAESEYDTKEQEITCNYTGLSKYAIKSLHNSRYSTFLNLFDYLFSVHYYETTRFIMNLYESITGNYLSSMSEEEYKEANGIPHTNTVGYEYYQYVDHYRSESDSYFVQCERALHRLVSEIDYKSFSIISGYLWSLQALKGRGITESYEEYKSHFGGEITEHQLRQSYNKIHVDIKELQNKIECEYKTILAKK